MQMKRKNGGVTAARIYKALEGDNPKKWYIGHGRGFIENSTGTQRIGPVLCAGMDQYVAESDRFNYTADKYRFHNQPSYQEIFSFNAIPQLTAGGSPTWTFGGVPINTKFRVESETWHFRFANSSFSSIILDFYQICPRRDIYVGEDGTFATSNLADNYASVGSTLNGANFDTSESENVFHHDSAMYTNGITPFDNRQLTQDYLIKGVGHKVMEPGSNFEWLFRKGRYTYETPDALNPVVAYRKGRYECLYVRIRGEPVTCQSNDDGTATNPTGTTNQDVTTAAGKLIWDYDYRIKWSMPIQELRNTSTVRQTDLGGTANTVTPLAIENPGFPARSATNASFAVTAGTELQVQAVPVPSGGLTGYVPTTV